MNQNLLLLPSPHPPTRSPEGLKAGAAALSDFLGVETADDGVLAALASVLLLLLLLAPPFAVNVVTVVLVVMGGGFRLLPSLAPAAGAVVALSPSVLMPLAAFCEWDDRQIN